MFREKAIEAYHNYQRIVAEERDKTAAALAELIKKDFSSKFGYDPDEIVCDANVTKMAGVVIGNGTVYVDNIKFSFSRNAFGVVEYYMFVGDKRFPVKNLIDVGEVVVKYGLGNVESE